MNHVLGLDYGTRRVGLAISRGSLAEPLMIVEVDAQLFNRLEQLCQSESIEAIVVGLSENQMADKTREFAQQLRTKLNIPIYYQDETLSSYAVATKLKDSKAKLKRRQQPIDDLAAATFLQEWLDEQRLG